MDWGRAKTILIFSFLILNLLLGYQIWFSNWGLNDAAKDTAAIKEETTKLMNGKHIRVVGEIPESIPKLREITIKFDEKLKPGQEIPLKTPIKIKEFAGGDNLADLIGDAPIANASAYRYDAFTSKNGAYVFNQMYGQFPMFDVNLTLYKQGDQVVAYKQAYVEVQSAADQKASRVISAYEAVHSLVENYLPEGSVIKDIRLGYGQMYNAETQYMLPSWRVLINDGEMYYVHAFSGAVETPRKPAPADESMKP